MVSGAFLCFLNIWPFSGAPIYTEQKWSLATGSQIDTHPAETYHNTTSQTSTSLTCPLSVSPVDAQWEAYTPIAHHQYATQTSHKSQRYSPLRDSDYRNWTTICNRAWEERRAALRSPNLWPCFCSKWAEGSSSWSRNISVTPAHLSNPQVWL